MALRPSRARSFLVIAAVYALALAVAVGLSVSVLSGLHPLWVVALADLAATLLVFAASVWLDNSSTYDAYWSVAPIAIAGYLAQLSVDGDPLRQGLVVGLVTWWGVRLTFNWARGWSGLEHEDWRYEHFRRKTGRWYWLVSLFGIHLFPTLQVFVGCLALWPALSSPRPMGWLDAFAALVTCSAIATEAVADRQLRAFVSGPKRPGAVLERGLWAWSRHPNYLGEMMFWWGLGLFALAADPGAYWALAGALAISLMFRLVSIPLLEQRMVERRPAFAQVQTRISMLLPFPPRQR